MYKVKLNKLPRKKMKDGGSNPSRQLKVNTSMKAVPREEANIEVEGGETAFGDINGDTFLELMTFEGKRHSKGGMPVNVPAGAFIFSDTKSLTIKDEELLKEMFNLSMKKGGWTPADVSKKFQINEYMETLKDPDAGHIEKRSAKRMVDKNIQKLGELAIIQESMKGFPDGIPDVAQHAMAGMGMSQEDMMQFMQPQGGEGMAEAKCGGTSHKLKKFQAGSDVTPEEIAERDGVWLSTNLLTLGLPYYADEGEARRSAKVFQKRLSKYDDPEIKGAYDLYKTALNSNDPTVIDDAVSHLNRIDVSGFYWMPDTEQHYVNQLSNILYKKGQLVKSKQKRSSAVKQAEKDKTEFKSYVKDLKTQWDQETSPSKKLTAEKAYKNAVKFLQDTPVVQDLGDRTTDAMITPQIPNLHYVTFSDAMEKRYGKNKDDVIVAKPSTSIGTRTSVAPQQTTTSKPKPAAQQQQQQSQSGYSYTKRKLKDGGLIKFQDGSYVPEWVSNPMSKFITPEVTAPESQGMPSSIPLAGGENYNLIVDPESGKMAYEDSQGNIVRTWSMSEDDIVNLAPEDQAIATAALASRDTNPPTPSPPKNGGSGSGSSSSSRRGSALKMDEVPDEYKKYFKKSGSRLQLRIPDDATYDEKIALNDWLNEGNKHSRIIQPISGGAGRGNFYGGLGPEDFEMKYAIEKFGREHADKMSVQERRDSYLVDFLGMDEKYRGSKADIYDDASFNKSYYEKFKEKLPGDEHRKSLGDDTKYGFDHWDALGDFEKIDPSDVEDVVDKNCGEGYMWNEEAQKCLPVPEGFHAQPKPGGSGEWWLPDIMNFMGAMTEDINKYYPTMGKVAFETPDFRTLDPTRRLAAGQEQMAQLADMLENTGSAPNALATMLASSGQGFANAANIIGDVENQNVGIANQAMQTTAQIKNQETAVNEDFRLKYLGELAVMNQNYDNAKRMSDWRKIKAFNRGTDNMYKKKWMEQVLYPDTYINPIFGDVTTMPSGREMLNEDGTSAFDTYQPAYGSKNASTFPTGIMGKLTKNYMDQGFESDEAVKMASVEIGHQYGKGRGRGRGSRDLYDYPYDFGAGMTFPFGGK